MLRLKNNEYILLLSFLALLVVPLLYMGRFLDTNSLTSWRWVFSGVGILKISLFLWPAILLALLLSQKTAPERHPLFFLLIVPVATAWALWSEPEALLDSARYFLQAKYLAQYGLASYAKEWGRTITAWTDMPLSSLLYGLAFKLFGETRQAVQILNTLLFTLTVALTYSIGKTLWDKETGFYGALLLLGIPYLLVQVPLMLADVHAMFFMTLAIYAFMNAVRKGGAFRCLGAAAAIFLALFSKYSTWPMLLVLPLIAVVHGKDLPGAAVLRRAGTVAAGAAVLAGAIFLWKHEVIRDQLTLLATYQWQGLRSWEESFVSTFFFQVHPFLSALALYGLYRAVKEKDARFLVSGWFAVFVLVLQVKRIRYMLPLFPLFTLMAAYGLNAISEKPIKRFLGLTVVASSLVILFGAYLPFLNRTSMANLKNAARYLDSLDCETVEVHVLPQGKSTGNTVPAIPQLDLFTRKKLFSAQNWSLPLNAGPWQRSSLRFTWEMKKPVFYGQGRPAGNRPLVIISSNSIKESDFAGNRGAGAALSVKRFERQAPYFRHKTLVTVIEWQDASKTCSSPWPETDNILPAMAHMGQQQGLSTHP